MSGRDRQNLRHNHKNRGHEGRRHQNRSDQRCPQHGDDLAVLFEFGPAKYVNDFRIEVGFSPPHHSVQWIAENTLSTSFPARNPCCLP